MMQLHLVGQGLEGSLIGGNDFDLSRLTRQFDYDLPKRLRFSD